MFWYDLLTFFTFIVGRHIASSAVSCRPKLVFGVFIQNLSNLPICSCTVVAFCRCLRFVPCTVSEAGKQSTAIQGSWRLCIAAYLHFLQTTPPRSFLQCLSNHFSFLDQCCYCCCGCSLAIASQADQNGVVLKMSEFLALLAIESHRMVAQHIEVAGSKGNTSCSFANILAVDLAWKKTENK